MRRIASALLALAFVGACSNGTSSPPPSSGTPEHAQIAGVDAIVRGRLAVSGATAAITIEDNYFKPNLLTAPAGATLTFTLANKGAGLHNFSIAEPKLDRDVPSTTNATVQVTVPASGRLVFFCKYHRDESGMIGAIDVS